MLMHPLKKKIKHLFKHWECWVLNSPSKHHYCRHYRRRSPAGVGFAVIQVIIEDDGVIDQDSLRIRNNVKGAVFLLLFNELIMDGCARWRGDVGGKEAISYCIYKAT